MIKELSIQCFMFTVFCLILYALCSMFHADFCLAATPHEEYKKIQKEIKTHKKKLADVKKRESSILTDIEYANRHLPVFSYVF